MSYNYEVISQQELVEAWFESCAHTQYQATGMPSEADFRQQFTKAVQVFLNDGWQLSGSVAVDAKGRLLQAVFRPAH